METSASFEARYAPLSYPTAGGRSAMVVPTATVIHIVQVKFGQNHMMSGYDLPELTGAETRSSGRVYFPHETQTGRTGCSYRNPARHVG